MQNPVNQELIAFRSELLQIWNEKRYLGRADILTKIRASFYNHDRKKAEDIDKQTIFDTEILQQNLTDALRLLIDSVGVTGKYLSSKPFYPPYFIGRQQDLKTVHDQLFGGNNLLMLVNGQGGMGKTSFAAKYWEMYECKYSHLANLYAGLGIADALLRLTTAFPELEFEPTMPTEERLKLLLQYIQRLEKPCLFVLDNVDDEKDLLKNYFALAECKNFHILLTSRLAKFKYAQKHTIDALSKEDALQVFTFHYEDFNPEETDVFYQLFEEVQGNTLVIDILAKNLAYLNRDKIIKNYTLQNLLDAIRKTLVKFENQTEVETEYHRTGLGFRIENPESIIMAMYDLSDLSHDELVLLSTISVIPSENIQFRVLEKLLKEEDREVLASKTWEKLNDEAKKIMLDAFANVNWEEVHKKYPNNNIIVNDLEKNMLLLNQKGWVEYNSTSLSFKINPVTQEVIRIKNAERIIGDCRFFMGNLMSELNIERVHVGNFEDSKMYALYAENFISKVKKTTEIKKYEGFEHQFIMLVGDVGNFYFITGDLDRSMYYFEEGLKLMKEGYISLSGELSYEDKIGFFTPFKLNMGDIELKKGNLKIALSLFEEYNISQKIICDQDLNNDIIHDLLSISYRKIGELYLMENNLMPSLYYFEQCNIISKKIKNKYSYITLDFDLNLAISYQKMGDINIALGNIKDSLNFFKEANSIFIELNNGFGGFDDMYNFKGFHDYVTLKNYLAVSYRNLGEAHIYLYEFNASLDFLMKGYEISNELYLFYSNNVDFKNEISILCLKIGDVYLALDNSEKSLFFLEECYRITKELHDDFPKSIVYKFNLSNAYKSLGWYFEVNTDNFSKSTMYYRECQKKLLELIRDFPEHMEYQYNLQWVEDRLNALS